MGVAEDNISVVVAAATQQLDFHTEATENFNATAGLFVKNTDNIGAGLSRSSVAAREHADAVKEDAAAVESDADAMKEASDKSDALTRNFRELTDVMRSAEWGDAELQGAITGMSAFSDELFALGNLAQAQEEAFTGFNESVKGVGLALDDTGRNFDLTTEAGRKQQDALQELAGTIDTEMAAAFDQADGDFATFKGNAETIAQKTLKRLQHELGLSDDETAALAASLGLLPEDIETRYELSGDEEAKIKIGLLQGAIDDLPKSVQTQVHQQIITGDYQGALNTIQNYYNNHPAQVRITFVTPQTLPQYLGSIGVGDRGGIAPSEGLIVAERRPEFVQLPGGRPGAADRAELRAFRHPCHLRRGDGADPRPKCSSSARSTAPPMTNVTINLPRGTRPDDAVRAADKLREAKREAVVRVDDRPVPSIGGDRPDVEPWPVTLHLGVERQPVPVHVYDDYTATYNGGDTYDDFERVALRPLRSVVPLPRADDLHRHARSGGPLRRRSRGDDARQPRRLAQPVRRRRSPRGLGTGISKLDIWAVMGGEEYWLFSGRITAWRERGDGTVEVEAFDAFSDLNEVRHRRVGSRCVRRHRAATADQHLHGVRVRRADPLRPRPRHAALVLDDGVAVGGTPERGFERRRRAGRRCRRHARLPRPHVDRRPR